MSKTMLSAATGTGKNADAFKQLGVSVVDANGQLRPTQDVLADLATKFQSMPDGPMKTAEAIAIFGKSGAALVPLLNKGKDGIDELMQEAQKLGIVIGDDQAAAAKKFEESMNKLGAAVTGAGNKLVSALLPQMQMVIDNVVSGAEETNSRMAALLQAAAFTGKAFVVAFGAVQTFFDSLGNLIQHMGADIVTVFTGLSSAAKDALQGNFKGAAAAVKDINAEMTANAQLSADDQKKIWKDYGEGVVEFWNATVEKVQKKPVAAGTTPAPANKAADNFEKSIQERITKLQDQAAAEGKLAQAIGSTTQATIVATAAADAQKTIDDLNAQGAKVHVQVTNDQAAAIQKATLLLASYKSALDANKQLEAQITKTQEATANVKELADAYSRGALAVEQAQESAKLTPFAKQVADLQGLIAALKSMGATAKDLAPLQSALTQLQQKYQTLTAAVHAEAVEQEAANLGKVTADMNVQITALKGYAIAVLGGAEALRQFNVEHQVQAFAKANPLLDAAQLEQYRQEVQKVSDAEQLKANVQKIASLDNVAAIQNEIDQLKKAHDQVQLNADQELAYDVEIHQLELQKQKDADDLLLKTNSLQAGVKAWFDEYTKQGTAAATTVKNLMDTAMSGITNNLAEMITTGKAKWSDFVNTIENDLMKLALNQIFKQLFQLIGGAFSGSSGGIGGLLGGIFGGGKAAGGAVNPGSLYAVGEAGPEWFVPTTAGTIVPNTAMGKVMSPGGGGTQVINQNITVNSPDLNSFKASQDQIASQSAAAASRAMRRNN